MLGTSEGAAVGLSDGDALGTSDGDVDGFAVGIYTYEIREVWISHFWE